MKHYTECAIGKCTFWLIALLIMNHPAFSQNLNQNVEESEPVFTENGAVKQNLSFNFYFESYHKMTLQEADRFNGNTFFANAIIPLSRSTQFRIELPFFTEGEAILTDAGDAPGEVVGARTHIKGYNGVFNLYSILIEHQFKSIAKNGFNFLGLFGGGYRLDPLETTFGDKYNHAGLTAITGFRVDGNLSRNVRFLLNSKFTFFALSDDVGPSDKGWDIFGGSDSWLLSSFSGAVMLPKVAAFTPVVESRFMTDLYDYNTFSAGPELILSLNNIDFQAGVLIGINNDAEDYRSRFQVSVHTFK